MPGMSSGLNADNPIVVSAFESTLLHQGVIAALVLLIMVVAWRALRSVELRRASQGMPQDLGASWPGAYPLSSEAPGRRLLRVGFGLLWALDGLLQAQPRMPLGMTTGVMQPAAATSPQWVQHVVNAGATIWSFHPIEAPASAVWIQLGLGIWLLVAPRGTWSRLAGVVAVSWGIIVWVFGEAFGGIFAPGFSWLYGAPGAALIYVVAGAMIALPEQWWAGARLGLVSVRLIGCFFAGMALLQAWPGRGFWEGHLRHGGALGSVPKMVHQMTQTPQPRLLTSWLKAFEGFSAAHGFAVNFFAVVALAALGSAFIWANKRVLGYAVGACWVLCLADWVLVQDLGLLGGVGTDPNSMVPTALVVTAAFIAITRPATLGSAQVALLKPANAQSIKERLVLRPGTFALFAGDKGPVLARRPSWQRGLTLPVLALVAWSSALGRRPGYVLRTTMALGALGIVVLGAAPMALASMQPGPSPIIAKAGDGTPTFTNVAARWFDLTDQYGKAVSLASLRGKTFALTFMDPFCTSDCPAMGQYFREADAMLPSALRKHVELVAIVANPVYDTHYYVQAYDDQEGMQKLSNWFYLTGPLTALRRTWRDYGVQVSYEPGAAMISHGEIAYVINANGHVRAFFQSGPRSGTEAQRLSWAEALASVIRTVAREG